MLTTATTWGITGPQFLWGYGVICLGAALVIMRQWRATLGPQDRGNDPLPDLGLYRLAMLAGGSQLAITTAATKLYDEGVITAENGRFALVRKLAPGADRLERAVAETLEREPGISAASMRAELADSEPVQWLTDELTQTGLLIDASQVTRVRRRLWLVAALLGLLGLARIAAGLSNEAPVGWLVVMVGLVLVATFLLARRPLHATHRGRGILRRQRREHDALRHNPGAGGQVALTAALFGGGALWLADPAIASSLGVPREDEWHSFGSGSSGASYGGSGCASGGGSSCGGGGGGGGGCGGGCGGGGGS
jgi:uncharacterized protein (TIGR04222 family)